jgi:pimeloyl-ACP methyl ester carboxylesterase
MKKLYLIPGLATDGRLFHRLELPGFEMKVIKWETFLPGDTMPSYAERLARQIDDTEPFHLLGVSFGGMCAVEVAKIKTPEKLILISSAKGSDELPLFIKMFRYFPLHRLFPQWFIIKLSEGVKAALGRLKDSDRELLVTMLREVPERYLNGSIGCIVSWDKPSRELDNMDVLHVHGTLDRVIPIRNIKGAIPVKGGTHFMVLNKAEIVNKVLQDKLKISIPKS